MDNEVNFDELLEDAGMETDNLTHIDDFEPANADEPQVDSEPETEKETDTEATEEPQAPDYSDNPLFSFMQSRGISDPSKLQFTEEDGSTKEVDFNTLTNEEQLEVLNALSDPGLTDNEYATINFLRKNRMDFNTALQSYANAYLQKYLEQNPDKVPQKNYEIDDYSDDDLYIVDLKRRYPNFTDEEILSRLESAKENEELFKKEAETLRNAYKEQEDQAIKDQELAEQQAATDLRNNLIQAAQAFNEVQLDYTDDKSDSLVIENGDKQQMISYILDKDADGKSQLIKDLENPDALIELAWLRTQGKEVLSNISKYWKGVLADERAENKKLRSQLEKVNKDEPTVVVSRKKTHSDVNSLWDDAI